MASRTESLPEVPSETTSHLLRNYTLRGRGKPLSIGDYAICKEFQTLKGKVELIKKLEDINNPDLEPIRMINTDKLEKQLAPTIEELKMAPTLDIVSRTLEETNRIIKVANNSGNLKGGYVRILKEAATVIKHAVTNMSNRSQKSPSAITDIENEKLRVALSQVRRDKDQLQERLTFLEQELRKHNPEIKRFSPPPQGVDSKRKDESASVRNSKSIGRKRVIIHSSSSDEGVREVLGVASPLRRRRRITSPTRHGAAAPLSLLPSVSPGSTPLPPSPFSRPLEPSSSSFICSQTATLGDMLK